MESAITQLTFGWQWWQLSTVHCPLSSGDCDCNTLWQLKRVQLLAAFGPDRLTSLCVFSFVSFRFHFGFRFRFVFVLAFMTANPFRFQFRLLPANCRGTSFVERAFEEAAAAGWVFRGFSARGISANVLKGHLSCRATSCHLLPLVARQAGNRPATLPPCRLGTLLLSAVRLSRPQSMASWPRCGCHCRRLNGI